MCEASFMQQEMWIREPVSCRTLNICMLMKPKKVTVTENTSKNQGQTIINSKSSHKSKTLFLNNARESSCTPPILRLQQDTGWWLLAMFIKSYFLLLSSQLRTKSPLQFAYYLLIRNGFSRFILLYYLRFLIDQLQQGKHWETRTKNI